MASTMHQQLQLVIEPTVAIAERQGYGTVLGWAGCSTEHMGDLNQLRAMRMAIAGRPRSARA